MTLASSESEGEGPSRGTRDNCKRTFTPATLSDSNGDLDEVKVIAGPTAKPCCTQMEKAAPAVKAEFVPATLSDSEVEMVDGPAPTPDRTIVSQSASKSHEQSPGTSKFQPMVLSSGESEQGYESPTVMMQAAASRKVKKELIPATLSDSASEGEESVPVVPAGAVKLRVPNNKGICERASGAAGDADENVHEDEDLMSVDLDALAEAINNAPVYRDYRFSHIPDDMLEPNDEIEGDEEDNTEDHEYGDETSDDAEYETDDEV